MKRYNTPEWEKHAAKIQRSIHQRLGNRRWDVIPRGQRWKLMSKVGYWLFSEPTSLPTEVNKFSGYEGQQLQEIESLCDKLTFRININESDLHFAVAFIFVGLDKRSIRESLQQRVAECEEELQSRNASNSEGRLADYEKLREKKEKLQKDLDALIEDQILPVFFCKTAESESYVIVDSWQGRRYASWQEFHEEENLPRMCRYCAPHGGFYNVGLNGRFEVEYHSPEVTDRKARRNFWRAATIHLSILLNPILGIIALIEFFARAANGQRFMLLNDSIIFPPALRVPGVRLRELVSASISLEIANRIVQFFRSRRYRDLTPLDVFQLKQMLLAFLNFEVDIDNVNIFKRAEKDLLSIARAGLLMHHEEQAPALENLVRPAQTIVINTTMDLLRALTQETATTSLPLEQHFDRNGKLMIIDTATSFIPHFRWLCVDEHSRMELFYSTERYANAIGTNDSVQMLASAKRDHQGTLTELCDTYRINFEDMHRTAIATLCTSYSENFERQITSPDGILVSDKAIFANLSGHQKTRLALVLQETLDNRTDLLRLANNFSEVMDCRVFRKFLKCAEFFAGKFYEKRSEILNSFRQQLLQGQTYAEIEEHIQRLLGAEFNEGPLIQHADGLALQFFRGNSGLSALINLIPGFMACNDERTPQIIDETVAIGTLTADLVSYRYQKHKYFEFIGRDGKLGLEDTLKLVENLTRLPVDRSNVMIVTEGSCTLVTHMTNDHGVAAVLINQFQEADDEKISGIATCLSYSRCTQQQ